MSNTIVPFVDLTTQYETLAAEMEPAVLEVLRSGRYALGEPVVRFERQFAAFCGTEHAVAVNSGTSALHLALLTAGVGPGSEVITVSHTFIATVAAIAYTGARPVLIDIDPVTHTMQPELIEAAITPRTKAIVPVHLYGQPAEMDAICEIAARHGLTVIEDAAQAHGAKYRGRPVGSIGQMGCFSFYPGKNLGACGEGGAITTSDASLAETLRMYRDWGMKQKYHHELLGFNYRMDAIQGAVLDVKLRHLPKWTENRRRAAGQYDQGLQAASVTLPTTANQRSHVYHLYVIRSPHRDALRDRLGQRGIQSGIHYPIPVHLQPCMAHLQYRRGDLPITEQLAGEILSLPMFPEISTDQVNAVCTGVVEEAQRLANEKQAA